jgi:hypothetical protein
LPPSLTDSFDLNIDRHIRSDIKSLNMVRPQKRTAVVSGQSVTGMMAAAILLAYGYDVIAIDKRQTFSRNIQWAGRQSFIDQLAAIDDKIADAFLTTVCRPISNGSTRIRTDGRTTTKTKPLPRSGDPARLPTTAHAMLDDEACFLVCARKAEQFLRNYLVTQRGFSLIIKQAGLLSSATTHKYGVDGIPDADLIVICEGARSISRDVLGIRTAVTSPRRLQMAGQVNYGPSGAMIKHYRRTRDDILETGTIRQSRSEATWLVTDVDPTYFSPDPRHRQAKDARQARLFSIDTKLQVFTDIAAQVFNCAPSQISRSGTWGATYSNPVPGIFFLQQRIVHRAYAGENVILLGDAVGNGHWNEGGGMQVGAVCHTRRLRVLLEALSGGAKREVALSQYSTGVIDDTQAWGERGIESFFPLVEPQRVVTAYRQSVQAFRENQAVVPGDRLHKIVTGRPLSADNDKW